GAMLEGDPKVDLSTNTVTRAIYVVDVASGPNQDKVALDVYTKTDAITTDFDTVTVTLDRTINLPLRGGTSVHTSMAANKQFLFVGTSRSPQGVEIDKDTFTVTQSGSFSPPINVSSITADQYGYVTMSFGSTGGNSGFIVYGPDGLGQEDGGGSQFML